MEQEAEVFYNKGIQAIVIEEYDAAEFFLIKSSEIDGQEANHAALAWLYGNILHRIEKALHYLRLALLANPENGELYNDYGALLLKNGSYTDAVQWLIRAVRLSPEKKKHYSLYNLAIAYHNRNQMRNSLRYLRMALRQKPEFQEALELYASIINQEKQKG